MKNPNRTAKQRRAENSALSRPDTLLIINSKNGSTRQYAEWICNAIDCDVIEYSRSKLGYASLYNNIIYGGWLRDAEITRMMMLKQNYTNFNLNGKKIVVFGVGITEPTDSYIKIVRERNLTGAFSDSPLFILPGRYDPSRIGYTDRTALSVMRDSMIQSVKEEERDLLIDRLDNGYNGIDATKIAPIVNEILKTRQ